MRQAAKQMKLGAFILAPGHHIASWRLPESFSQAPINFDWHRKCLEITEKGKFDLFFLGDFTEDFSASLKGLTFSPLVSTFEPLTMLAALAMFSTRVGLVGTATTTFNEPFHLARKFASLDHLSGGRAGWNMVTSANPHEARNFSTGRLPKASERYERAREFSDVVMSLWDSWDDDAFSRDKAAGRYFDPEKLHLLNHVGSWFSVMGPLPIERSPQGRPIIVQSGASDEGIDLAAATADVVFTAQADIGLARAFYEKLKRRTADHGRDPDDVKIMPGIFPLVGATTIEAEARLEQLQSLIDPEFAVSRLSMMAGVDLSAYPIEGPIPNDIDVNASPQRTRLQAIIDLAHAEALTIKQTAERFIGTKGHFIVMGTATDVADKMEEWFLEGAADGFNIMAPVLPIDLARFVDQVVPELQRRGIFRLEYEGITLRDNLGLRKAL